MQMYTRVESSFWQDEKMRAVSGDARHLMLYCLTSPHRNILGFYFLPAPYACFDLGWDEKRFTAALTELLNNKRIKYDFDKHVILVVNYLKHNPLGNPNQTTSAIKKLEELPDTKLLHDFAIILEQFTEPFIEPLKEQLQQRLQAFPNPSETLSKGLDNPSETLLKQGTGTGTGTGTVLSTPPPPSPTPDGVEEGAPAQPQKRQEQPDEQRKRAKTPVDDSLFARFWAAYPKKRSKGQAEKAWAKLQPDEQLVETMLAAIERAKTSEEWRKEGGRYIPYPATWLNAKGWEDEYTPVEEVNRIGTYQQGFIKPGVTKSLDEARRNRFAALYQNTES